MYGYADGDWVRYHGFEMRHRKSLRKIYIVVLLVITFLDVPHTDTYINEKISKISSKKHTYIL